VLAVPVGAPETIAALASECDEVVCLIAPEVMWAIGYWYEDFGQTSDAEVSALLLEAAALSGAESGPGAPVGTGAADPPRLREVTIPAPGGGQIIGDLAVPEHATGLVVFAHGSGSSRHSPRNREVAAALNRAGLATLLIDLLTLAEERERSNVFDIALLAERLGAATRWVREQPGTAGLGLGYFGASTGAAAASSCAMRLWQTVHQMPFFSWTAWSMSMPFEDVMVRFAVWHCVHCWLPISLPPLRARADPGFSGNVKVLPTVGMISRADFAFARVNVSGSASTGS